MLLALWSPKGGPARRSSQRRPRSSSPAALPQAAASPISAATSRPSSGSPGSPSSGSPTGSRLVPRPPWRLSTGCSSRWRRASRCCRSVLPIERCVHVRRPRRGPRSQCALRDLPVPVVADCGRRRRSGNPRTRRGRRCRGRGDTRLLPRAAPRGARAGAALARRAPCSSTSRGARCRGARSPTCSACRCWRGSRCATRSHERSMPVCWRPVCPTRSPALPRSWCHERGSRPPEELPRDVGPLVRRQCRCLRPTTS